MRHAHKLKSVSKSANFMYLHTKTKPKQWQCPPKDFQYVLKHEAMMNFVCMWHCVIPGFTFSYRPDTAGEGQVIHRPVSCCKNKVTWLAIEVTWHGKVTPCWLSDEVLDHLVVLPLQPSPFIVLLFFSKQNVSNRIGWHMLFLKVIEDKRRKKKEEKEEEGK